MDDVTKRVAREPTQEMIDAGWIATGPQPDPLVRKHYLSEMWRAMFDAAPTVGVSAGCAGCGSPSTVMHYMGCPTLPDVVPSRGGEHD